jgi:enoyl-CoA hydratase
MALTGARLDGAECRYLGLATHFVPQAALPELLERLAAAPARAAGAAGHFAGSPPAARIEQNLPNIARLFAPDTLEEIIAALEAEDSDWAQSELATLSAKSPTSCKVSLRLLREGAERESFEEEMRAEYALACRVVQTHDFVEGVRALLIDKDNSPTWQPAAPAAVLDDTVDQLFVPLPPEEAWTAFPERA